jgi:hypothetical protein
VSADKIDGAVEFVDGVHWLRKGTLQHCQEGTGDISL